MHPILLYLLGCMAAGLIGIVSGYFVLLIGKLLRGSGSRSELAFGFAAVFGLAALTAGRAVDSRWLVGVGLLLSSWMVLPFFAIPVLILWRFSAWCSRRFAA
jgi:hypothetical protein